MCVQTYMHACIHTYQHTYIHTCIHAYIILQGCTAPSRAAFFTLCLCSLFFMSRSVEPRLNLRPVVPVLRKWIGVLHGKFRFKFILSIILGGSLYDAGLVLSSLAPKPTL